MARRGGRAFRFGCHRQPPSVSVMEMIRSRGFLAVTARAEHCQTNGKQSSVEDQDHAQTQAKESHLYQEAGRYHSRSAQGADRPKQGRPGERLAGIGTGRPWDSPTTHRARFNVAPAPDDLVAATRRAIADATDFDDRDINTNFDYDY